jgi:hypothetical protein
MKKLEFTMIVEAEDDLSVARFERLIDERMNTGEGFYVQPLWLTHQAELTPAKEN